MTLVTLLACGCSCGESTGSPTSKTESTTTATTTTDGSSDSTTATSAAASTKPGTGLQKQLKLSKQFTDVGTPVDFEARFEATTQGDSIRFTKNNDGVAELAVDVSAELSADGEPTSVNGTVTASDNGAGTAQLGVEITRNGSAQETRLTIFVEADLGYAAFGDASESTTRRTLADGLLEANAINQEAYTKRIAAIEGATG